MVCYYTLEYNKTRGLWVIWKNIEKEGSLNFYSVFEGSKNECKEVLNKINGKRRV